MSKVAVIGLDGATWRILDPLIEDGKLPFFQKLKEEGVCGELETTTPPVTASAWPSFMTGKKPESHGIYGFELIDDDSVEYINGSYIKDERFWEVASQDGKRTCVANVPVTYPPHEVYGVMVSGMTTPSENSDFTYPEDLKEELIDEYDYEIEARGLYSLEDEDFLDEIYRVYDKRKKAITDLKNREDWDLFVSVLRITDILTHFYWDPEQQEVEDLFKDVDTYLSQLVGELTDEGYQVLLMSDHGMVMSEHTFDINKWLRDNGYQSINEERSFLESLGVTKSNISDFVNKLGLRDVVKRFVPNNVQEAVPDGRGGMAHQIKDGKIDLEKTDFLSTGMGAVLIFDYADGEEKIRNLKEELDELTGPEGKKVFDSFEFKDEDRYRGRGPALTGRLNKEFVIGDVGEGYFGEPDNAYHSYTGIFGAIGNGIVEGERRDAEIIDIAPTVLHLMDLDIPGYMEGKVLNDIEKNPSKPEKRLVDDLDI